MSLPIPTLPTGSVDVDGVSVPIRSLTRAQALKLGTFRGKEDEAEVFILVAGADVSDDEARAWRESVDTDTGGLLIDAILVLSGLAKEGTNPNPNGATSEP
jgi:hypothetical protein